MAYLRIAKEVGISVASLYNYLKLNPELKNGSGNPVFGKILVATPMLKKI